MRSVMRALGLAEYGGDELLICLIACSSLGLLLYVHIHPLTAIIPLIPLAIVVWFFRDPQRRGDGPENVMLSPADGTVTDIIEVDEPDFIGGRALRIGIFLSPFNVHVNRSPCAGTVRYSKFKAGEFLPAYNPQAPERNESCSLGLEIRHGTRIVVKQITGVLARRIICEAHAGDLLARGQRYGMIKFGSRTELYIPLSAGPKPLVKVDDKVTGGLTAFCEVAAGSPQSRGEPQRLAETI
jgi:phosphatidylserine decarboxylase